MKWRLCVLALLIAGFLTGSARAVNLLEFPRNVKSIEAEAFLGVGSVDEVRLPEGVVSIGDRAFKDMGWLQTITIPGTVTGIGRDILEGTMDAVLIQCQPDSAAMRYAVANRFDYDADTECRALLIGNEYIDTDNALLGPYNDLEGMWQTLSRLSGRPFGSITVENDCTFEDMDRAIAQAFAGARPGDISLFYFSGHGGEGGTLFTDDGLDYSPEHLRQCLDAIPGRKVIIIDACFSGGLIADDGRALAAPGTMQPDAGEVQSELQSFQAGFLSAFKPRRLARSAFNPSDYFVLTAARYDQESTSVSETLDDGEEFWYGLFTYCLCRACGYDFVSQEEVDMEGDDDGDCAVSMAEAYASIEAGVWQVYEDEEWDPDEMQLVQVYPGDCRWFAPFRNAY